MTYNPVKYWNRRAKHSKPYVEWEPFFLNYIEKDYNVLDIGSGRGNYVISLIKRGINAVGCDISEEYIKVSEDNCNKNKINSSNKFYLWKGTNLPFSKNSFDIVVTFYTLQHVVNNTQIKIIFRDVNRVLKNSGYFCIVESASPIEFQTTKYLINRTINKYVDFGRKNDLHMTDIEISPNAFGSMIYLYQRINGINHWNTQNLGSSPTPINNLEYTQQNNNLNFTKKISRFLVSISNNYLNPLIKTLKIEKYFCSRVRIIFKKNY